MKSALFKINPKIEITFDYNDMEDILCCAFEGGCGYWACLDNTTETWKNAKMKLKEETGDIPTLEEIMIKILTSNESIEIMDEEENKRYFLNLKRILNAIKNCIEKGYWDGDIDTADGSIGDTIIQMACFDEIVYG